jgi:hypothetical protein
MEGDVKFGNRRPGTSMTFVDALTQESILQFASDAQGRHLMAFRLYDSRGAFVAESGGLQHYPDGLTVRSDGGEVLLIVPPDCNKRIQYRLYNRTGNLLTSSDGLRTMIYQLLRMEGVDRDWAPPLPGPTLIN